jgi:hypothetical protein
MRGKILSLRQCDNGGSDTRELRRDPELSLSVAENDAIGTRSVAREHEESACGGLWTALEAEGTDRDRARNAGNASAVSANGEIELPACRLVLREREAGGGLSTRLEGGKERPR